MFPLFLTILLASLVGSLHCAGMCGAFVAFAIGAGDPSVKTPRLLLQSFYHLGRLFVYLSFGALAGLLGATLDFGGSFVGLQRTAAIAAGAMMVAFAVLTLLRLLGAKIRPLPIPKLLTTIASAGHSRTKRLAPPLRALATGLLTTLLPCGWLYAFVITAAGTAHPALGALTMFAFWLGTLPVLATIGFSLQGLSRLLGAKLPALTATAILLVGLYTIYTRAAKAAPLNAWAHKQTTVQTGVLNFSLQPSALTPPCCTAPSSTEAEAMLHTPLVTQ